MSSEKEAFFKSDKFKNADPTLKALALYRAIEATIDQRVGTGLPAALMRLEFFLQSSKLAAEGLLSIIIEMDINEGREPKMPADEQLYDVGLYASYVLVAQQRRFARNRSGLVMDFLQEGLELFALNENRPFYYLRHIDELLRTAKRH